MSLTLTTVRIDQITIAPQVRREFNAEDLKALAESIESTGLQQPPMCRRVNGVLNLIDGERRIRAMLLLGRKEIDVLVVAKDVDDLEATTRQLICNLQRADLNPVERAEAIQAVMQQSSGSAQQVGKTLGLRSADMTRSLAILKLSAPLREQVASGLISPDAAYQLSRVSDPAQQEALAADVAAKRLSRDGLARKLKRVSRQQKDRESGPSRVTATLGGGRSVTLAGKGLTLDSMIDWLEQFLTRARKSKSQGLSLETFVRTLRDQAAKT